jgi:hypothetical protein
MQDARHGARLISTAVAGNGGQMTIGLNLDASGEADLRRRARVSLVRSAQRRCAI